MSFSVDNEGFDALNDTIALRCQQVRSISAL
jgi:hypothetical protein